MNGVGGRGRMKCAPAISQSASAVGMWTPSFLLVFVFALCVWQRRGFELGNL